MVNFDIKEAISAEVANCFDEHNLGVDVDNYVEEDGEWVLIYWSPAWVENNPLGPATPKAASRDRIAVETLLNNSAYVELIYGIPVEQLNQFITIIQ